VDDANRFFSPELKAQALQLDCKIQDRAAFYDSRKVEVTSLGMVPPAGGKSDMNFIRGTAAFDLAQPPAGEGAAPGAALTVQGLPLFKPPYGAITAINLDKGEIVWQAAHGETPDNVRNNPALRLVSSPISTGSLRKRNRSASHRPQ
jgi:hypothetical protein